MAASPSDPVSWQRGQSSSWQRSMAHMSSTSAPPFGMPSAHRSWASTCSPLMDSSVPAIRARTTLAGWCSWRGHTRTSRCPLSPRAALQTVRDWRLPWRWVRRVQTVSPLESRECGRGRLTPARHHLQWGHDSCARPRQRSIKTSRMSWSRATSATRWVRPRLSAGRKVLIPWPLQIHIFRTLRNTARVFK